MNRAETAIGLFSKGANCAQSVLGAFAPELGMDAETAMRVSTGLGGGLGRMANVCGAITGGILVLGLAGGMRKTEEQEKKVRTYSLVKEMCRRFTGKNSFIVCKDILGVDIGTEEGWKAAKEKNLFDTVCAGCVKDAVEIVSAIMSDPGAK